MSMLLGGLKARARERQLAGDNRAGSWARNRMREAYWRWARRNWRFLATSVGGALLLALLLAYFSPSQFLGGLLAGAILVGTMAAIAAMVLLTSGMAYRSMGATAEAWTASELRRLRRRGWRLANHVSLGSYDIDHVLLGPGGVIAVETKWSATGWTLDPPDGRILAAIAQARRNAKNLRYWHDLKSAGLVDVASVVFLWGQGEEALEQVRSPVVIDGTTVVLGVEAARSWRLSLNATESETSKDQLDRYWQAIDERVRMRDVSDRLREPQRPSLFWIYWQAAGCVIAAFSALYTLAEVLQLESAYIKAALIVAMLALGVVARLHRQTKIPALGWLTALAVCLAAVGLAGVIGLA